MLIYGRSEELVSRCVECDLAEPESLASLGGSAPGFVDGSLSFSVGLAPWVELGLDSDGLLGPFLTCCCWATIARVCSSGVLSEGFQRPWFNNVVYLDCVSLNKVSGVYPGVLATVDSKKRMCVVHSAGALIFL